MKYSISYNNPQNHFIDFKVSINVEDKTKIQLQLPSWRPGRYELGNFAKNIKDFKVFDDQHILIPFKKLTKDLWLIETNKLKEVNISYSYYAAELNAGSTFLNEEQLYINPVNCMLYLVGDSKMNFQVDFSLPKEYQLFSSLKKIKQHTLSAVSFDELADSPIIASPSVNYENRNIAGVNFHFCFQGEAKVDWNKIRNDFDKFINHQINLFGSFPHKEFYFLFQITPFKAYHGVEHHKSTVILLGPSYDVFGDLYSEFLGVSSHELYHVWNVKSIRPEDMHPYDFSKENYTQLGYVTEGVTTYMGDRVLYESGVFSKDDYFKELRTLLIRHFHNDGRNHSSVAESSWDTWLDGYVVGAPGRKVSIYVEGALIALICDAKVREVTNNEKSLHDVMKAIYAGFGKESSYNHKIYQTTLEKVSGFNFTNIFDDLVFGHKDFSIFLQKALNSFGWTYLKLSSKNTAWQYGFKTIFTKNTLSVSAVLENSAAFDSGLAKDDKILAINSFIIDNDLKSWLDYFSSDTIVLTIQRENKIKELNLNQAKDQQYYDYKLKEK